MSPVSREFPYPSGSPVKKPSERERGSRSISSALLVLKPPLNEPPLQLPQWAPMERDASLQSLPLYILQEPQLRSIPSNFPSQSSYRHTPFPEASLLSLEVPRKRTSPSGPQRDPYGERCSFSEPFFKHRSQPHKKGPMIKSHLSLEVPGKGATSLFSQWGTYRERGFVSRAKGLFINSYPPC